MWREATSAGFFTGSETGENIVREGIQNSLDARLTRGQKCRVRIYASNARGALPATVTATWLEGLQPHLKAVAKDLPDRPTHIEPCSYLVFEDFGTKGLNGDIALRKRTETRNDFFGFFFSEGASQKTGIEQGSNGIGKIVFTRTSRIRTFFGLTIRSEDQREVLMGRSILKIHEMDGSVVEPDGFWAVDNNGRPDPCEERSLIAEFKRTFNLSRQDESGLSIVVPYYGSGEDMTPQKLALAALRHFYYPILLEHLSVEVESPTEKLLIQANNLLDLAEQLAPGEKDLRADIELALDARTRPDSDFFQVTVPPTADSQKWDESLVPRELVDRILERDTSRPLAVRIPVQVQRRDRSTTLGVFDVFLQPTEENTHAVFVRNELIIPRAGGRNPGSLPKWRALVRIDDQVLSSFLRAAENPAHTEWTEKTENFKKDYMARTGVLGFVQAAPRQLLEIATRVAQKPTSQATANFFYIVDHDLPGDEPVTGDEEPDETPERTKKPFPVGQPQPQAVRLLKNGEGGFILRPNAGFNQAAILRVRCAYQTRSGDAFAKYSPADFDVASNSVAWQSESRGLAPLLVEHNRLEFRVNQPEWVLSVTGFDANRNLSVRWEVRDADQEA
jgi:hypothetical protein